MQVLDPTQHSASAEALEAIEFFAHEVQPLLNRGQAGHARMCAYHPIGIGRLAGDLVMTAKGHELSPGLDDCEGFERGGWGSPDVGNWH